MFIIISFSIRDIQGSKLWNTSRKYGFRWLEYIEIPRFVGQIYLLWNGLKAFSFPMVTMFSSDMKDKPQSLTKLASISHIYRERGRVLTFCMYIYIYIYIYGDERGGFFFARNNRWFWSSTSGWPVIYAYKAAVMGFRHQHMISPDSTETWLWRYHLIFKYSSISPKRVLTSRHSHCDRFD